MGTTHLDALQIAGVPTMGVNSLPLANNYWFVSSVSGNDGFSGTQYTTPYATIGKALTAAATGDCIVLLEGHAETVSAAGGITQSTAGVYVIGLGEGATRPTFTFSTSTAATWLITGASSYIANIVGVTGIDQVVSPFVVQAASCTLGSYTYGYIEWQDPDSTHQAVRTILTTAAADKLAIYLKTIGVTSGGTSPVNAVRLVGVDSGVIDLDFYGRASTAVVEFVTTAVTNVEIYGYIYNSGTTGTKNVIDTVTGSTWFASFNDGVAGLAITGGSGNPLATSVPGSVRLATKTIAAAGTTLTTGNSPVTLFTVTGDVLVRVWGTVQTTLVSTLNTGTLSVGVLNSVSALIATTTVNGTNLVALHSWFDASTALAEQFNSAATASAANWTSLAGSQNITCTIATNSCTAGAITIYCQYIPISSGSGVVAA